MAPVSGSTSPKKVPTKLTDGASPKKVVSGLPSSSSASAITPYSRDVHMETAKGLPSTHSYSDIRMNTAKSPFETNDDIYMETARGNTSTVRQGVSFQPWEKDLLASPEVKRKATVAQLCESHPPFSLPGFFIFAL